MGPHFGTGSSDNTGLQPSKIELIQHGRSETIELDHSNDWKYTPRLRSLGPSTLDQIFSAD